MTEEERDMKRAALANFLFPKDGEWQWYVSPKGYSILKVVKKQAKEQAA